VVTSSGSEKEEGTLIRSLAFVTLVALVDVLESRKVNLLVEFKRPPYLDDKPKMPATP